MVPIRDVTSYYELVTSLGRLEVSSMETMERMLDEVIDELESELSDASDPLLALASCVGTVLLYWETLDGQGRRALLNRVQDTVHDLEQRARMSVNSERTLSLP